MDAISAVIISYNEEESIAHCLSSVEKICEEIVVLDAYSEDNTRSICKEFRAKVYTRTFDNFSAQKNAAVSYASYPYVLSLDADERLSKELIASIQAIKSMKMCDGYWMNRLSFYKNIPVRSCGWYPNQRIRLWHKEKGAWDSALLHENVVMRSGARTQILKGDILHYTYRSLAQIQYKGIQYSQLYAENFRFRKHISPGGAFIRSLFAFQRAYFLQGGFRERYVGLLIAWAIANGTFYKYIKLFEANQHLSFSLIITTYNSPKALKVVLDSVRRQSELPTEVIVADDGSGTATHELIKEVQQTFPIPLKYCWQEDHGFRLSRVRNKALAMAQGEYVMILDGDTFLHKHTVRTHRRYCQKGLILHSSRILLNKQVTGQVLEKDWKNINIWRKCIINGIKGLYMPWLSKLCSTTQRGIYGVGSGRISAWKEDMYAVNGFNEAIEGWGLEDNEFFARMIHRGLRIKKIRCAGICYHLYHKLSSRDFMSKNQKILDKTVAQRKTYCAKGVHLHLKEGSAIEQT